MHILDVDVGPFVMKQRLLASALALPTLYHFRLAFEPLKQLEDPGTRGGTPGGRVEITDCGELSG